MHARLSTATLLWHGARFGLLASLVLVGGCSAIRVSNQSSAQTLAERQTSILDRDQLSEPTLKTLYLTGQDQRTCLANLERCLSSLRQVPEVSLDDYLSSASELYLAHMQRLQTSSACRPALVQTNAARVSTGLSRPRVTTTAALISAADRQQCRQDLDVATLETVRHAYAYLFVTAKTNSTRPFTGRPQQVLAFYHLATARWIERRLAPSQIDPESRPAQPLTDPAHPAGSPAALGDATQVSLQPMSALLQQRPPVELIAANTLNFSGLRTINRRDGVGVEFVAILPDAAPVASSSLVTAAADNLHRSQYLPLTAVMRVGGTTLQQIMKSRQFVVELYDPFQTAQISMLGQNYPLAANFSAPYGLWLARTDLNRLAYRHLLGRSEEGADTRPQLYMLEPYDPAKRVILLLHGIASSPEAWLSLTNDILGDAQLRRRYQVWQIFYPTNLPMLENRYQIQQTIEAAYRLTDPAGHQPASQQSVLIGHSMGGVIARLMVSPTDLTPATLPTLSPREQAQLQQVPQVSARLRLRPLPQVGRAIFVSAPFAGTDYADKWFTRAIRRTVQLPSSIGDGVMRVVENASLSERVRQQVQASGILNLQNGPADLSPRSRFNQITTGVQIQPSLPFHLIMGRDDPDGALEQSTDGIVPYRSAHLSGAVSEKVIEGGHSIQLAPEAVVEFRRILRQHLIALGDMPPESQQLDTLDSPLGLSAPQTDAPAKQPVAIPAGVAQ